MRKQIPVKDEVDAFGDIAQHYITKAEIRALEHAIRLFKKYPKEMVIESLEKYIQELKGEL